MAAPRPLRWRSLLLAAAALLVLGVSAALLLGRPWRAAPIAIHSAAIAAILADPATELTAFRLDRDPSVLVLDFPSLHSQARMLNRVAAFVEKAGMPHDRTLNDAALNTAIRASGETYDTFYEGHDYRAADLVRFMDAAARDDTVLTAEEHWLATLMAQEGWSRPDAKGALITLPRAGAADDIDAAARETILRHELSHAAYFTSPAYADFVAGFWRDALTGAERAAFRRYLSDQGYDTGIEDLMINETQAYLMFTRDKRFFDAAALGIPAARLDALRARFYADMPDFWLRETARPRRRRKARALPGTLRKRAPPDPEPAISAAS